LFLYVYALLVVFRSVRKHGRTIQNALELGQKELLLWGAFPTAIFLALPDKLKAVIQNFEAGKDVTSGFAPDRLLFYVRSFLRDYSLIVPIGILVLGLLLAAVLNFKHAPLGVRGMALFSLIGYLSLTFGFKFQESRHLAVFVPAVWLVAAWSAEFLVEKLSRTVRLVLAGSLFLAAPGIALLSSLPVTEALERTKAVGAIHEASFRPLVDAVVKFSDNARSVYVSGALDAGFSPLLSWKLEIAHFRERDFGLKFGDTENRESDLAAFERMAADAERDVVILFLVQNGKSQMANVRRSEILRGSGHYVLQWEQAFQSPVPLKLLAFRKKEAETATRPTDFRHEK
jgi:hypothetical protein